MALHARVWVAAVLSATLCGCERAPPGLQIGRSFTASTFGVDTTMPMPDAMGAVGEHHVVELINGRYSVYRKSDGRRLQSRTLAEFWTDAGAGPIHVTLDPRLVYDPFSRRWFASAAHKASADNPHTLLLAVSRSSDPTEGWTGFNLGRDPSGQRLGDFPTLGLDADAVYIRAGLVDDETCQQVIVVVPKADLLAPAPTVANATQLGEGMECFGGLSPAVDFDNTGLPFYLFQSESAVGKASLVSVTGSVRAPALARREISTGTHPFAPPADQPPAPTQKPGIRVFYSITAGSVLRDGAIWSLETVGHENRAALRWLKVDPNAAAILEEGLISDPVLHFYNGSIAVNDRGDVVIAFNGSSSNQFVSIYGVAGVTGAGATVFGRPTLVQAGVDDFGLAHWGDYSATVVDPVDASRFWTFQEWVSGDDVYSTQITELVVAPRRRWW